MGDHTLAGRASHEIEVKHSRFLALAAPADSPEAALAFVAEVGDPATGEPVGATEDNLKSAIAGETYEFTSMYPSFIEDAVMEGEKQSERSFHFANEAEKVHANLFRKARENLLSARDVDYFVCSVGGYIAEEEAPDTCPICGAKKEAFKLVE